MFFSPFLLKNLKRRTDATLRRQLGDTGGHTGAAPTHLHHIFPRNPTQTKFRPCAIHPKRNQPSMCNPPLPISTKPHGVSLPHRGYTFDSAGLASATQPTLGNNASKEATPPGGCTFSHRTSLPYAANRWFPARKLILKSTMPMA